MAKHSVRIDDTFAEAFDMKAVRLVVTADTPAWALEAGREMTGFATSVIACGVEAGIERELAPAHTPDGRPGVAVILFAVSSRVLQDQLLRRCGQCVMTAPTSSLFAGGAGEVRLKLGSALRYFGDGQQAAKRIRGRRYWRIPVMEGEFLCEDYAWQRPAVGGGNLLFLARTRASALKAARYAVAAMRKVEGVVLPFPGGIVRSGSKLGSRYKALPASSNLAYCPTLKGRVASALDDDTGSVMEIVANGLDAACVREAMRAGVKAACSLGWHGGLIAVSAANYGGKLGAHHFHLKELSP